MAIKKESLNNFLPDGFETLNQEGYKENFSADKIQTGYQKDVPELISGPNLNNLIDIIGKNTNTLNSYVEYLNSLSVNKTPIVDSNNQLNSTQIGLKVYSPTETYLLNDLVTTIQDEKVLFYKSLVASNTGNPLTNTDYWEEVKLGGGSGLELCDIGMALYVDETKGLRRYLNGQIVDRNTNTEAFFTRLQEITTLHPSLLCTEDEWQTAKTMSVFGQVGKFVFNYSGDDIVSVRLPRVVNVQGVFDLQKLGMTIAESLPQHTHYIGDRLPSITSAGGNPKADVNGNDGYQCVRISNTQGASSPVYKDGAPVQPEAIQYPYFIQIATGSETENNIINDIELNNPYSLFDHKYSDHELNNLSWLKSEGQQNAKAVYTDAYDKLLKIYNGTETVEGLSVKLSTEEYTDYDFVLNTSDETFRLPLKTKLASGKAVVGNGKSFGLTNGTVSGSLLMGLSVSGSQYYAGMAGTFGEVGSNTPAITMAQDTAVGVTTDPTKSGIETSDSGLYLYYYVGETVQNANLIDAGRIGEQLADKIGRTECKAYITETYVNGPSWYRVWSDGWCEQGGYTTIKSGSNIISFLKKFVTNDPKQISVRYGRVANATTTNVIDIFSRGCTDSQVDFYSSNSTGITWQASGYIK